MAGKKRRERLLVWWPVFLLYTALMVWLLFGQRLGTGVYTQHLAEGMNLTPLATLKRYWLLLRGNDGDLVRHAFVNLVGNVVMFVPLGFLLPRLFPNLRRFFRSLFLAAVLIVAVEVIQYVTMLGTCDVDDLILNLPGVMLGYWLYRLFLH